MNNNADFTAGSIPKKLIGFMLPILAALVLQAMYSAVDLMIVGHFGTTEGLSGVSTGASIIQLFTFFTVALTMGVTVVMGLSVLKRIRAGDGVNQYPLQLLRLF